MIRCIVPRCTAKAVQRHHVITKAEIKRWGGDVDDPRILVGVCVRTHERHHQRISPLPLWVLPDSVFEYAEELMGAGAAHNYLERFYSGGDPRLDRLLDAWENAQP